MTGGAGFIGSHLTKKLAGAGHDVRILDSLVSDAAQKRVAGLTDLPHVQFVEGDIRDADSCRRAVAGADFVLHHAAEASVPHSVDAPAECVEINIEGTVKFIGCRAQSGHSAAVRVCVVLCGLRRYARLLEA